MREDGSYLEAVAPQPVGELSQGTMVSQTFMPMHDGLRQVTLFLATYARQNQGELTFTLLDAAGQVVHEEHFDAASVVDNGLRGFLFDPQPRSAGRAYTVRLTGDAPPGAGITAWSDTTERYPGRLRFDGEVLPGDLAIKWYYEIPPSLLLARATSGLARYGVRLFLALLLWTLPGWALLAWVRRGDDEPWSVQRLLASSVALSGALLLVVPQATLLLPLRLGPWALWLLIFLAGAGLLLARRRGWPLGPTIPPDGVTVLYLALLALVAASRFLAIHEVAAPMWGDGVHHTLITQLVLDRGGIPDNYLPYAPLQSFTYHAGFHLLCGWLAWALLPGMSALSAPEATLLGGQLLNVWAVMMVGLLAEGLARRSGDAQRGRWAGVLALLLAGFFSPIPAFYVNWGRYTQLAGMIFLPPAVLWSLWWEPTRPRRVLPIVLVLAALALSHYLVLMMYLVLLPLLVALLLWHFRARGRALLRVAGQAAVGALVCLLLILPWYVNLLGGVLAQRLAQAPAQVTNPATVLSGNNVFGDITTHVPEPLLALAALALLWLLLRRAWGVALLMGGWVVMWFVLANPYLLLRLPGTGLVNNFMIQISLYLPLAATAALGLADVAFWLLSRLRLPTRPLGALAAGGVLLLALRGLGPQMALVDMRHFAMQTPQDQQAATWIQQHTPPNARFHITGFPAFYNSVVAGTDGGWWLWLSARRETTVPPMVYDSERGPTPDYRRLVNERHARLRAAQGEPERLAAALRAEQVEFVYVGAQQGRIGLPGDATPLDPLALASSPAFETVYSDDFVWVFRVRDSD